MKYGELLKKELRERGFVFKFVAEQTGIPYGSLTQYLNDFRPIPESKLRHICLAFGIDLKIFGLVDRNSIQEVS